VDSPELNSRVGRPKGAPAVAPGLAVDVDLNRLDLAGDAVLLEEYRSRRPPRSPGDLGTSGRLFAGPRDKGFKVASLQIRGPPLCQTGLSRRRRGGRGRRAMTRCWLTGRDQQQHEPVAGAARTRPPPQREHSSTMHHRRGQGQRRSEA
jgi:hypothetical protein